VTSNSLRKTGRVLIAITFNPSSQNKPLTCHSTELPLEAISQDQTHKMRYVLILISSALPAIAYIFLDCQASLESKRPVSTVLI
jgi:hypothetical protein